MKRLFTLLLAILLLPLSAAMAADSASTGRTAESSLRVLLIVAHPDDEYEMAGTVYRIAKELSGTVDQLIITTKPAITILLSPNSITGPISRRRPLAERGFRTSAARKRSEPLGFSESGINGS
jgi:hypothetical protein